MPAPLPAPQVPPWFPPLAATSGQIALSGGLTTPETEADSQTTSLGSQTILGTEVGGLTPT
jgi:hypothetical protein